MLLSIIILMLLFIGGIALMSSEKETMVKKNSILKKSWAFVPESYGFLRAYRKSF